MAAISVNGKFGSLCHSNTVYSMLGMASTNHGVAMVTGISLYTSCSAVRVAILQTTRHLIRGGMAKLHGMLLANSIHVSTDVAI